MARIVILFLCIGFSFAMKAQKIDSIYVHLYTDSLKKGTYNYINIDGKLSNGRYLPLDTSQLTFTCSDGKFYGNTLFLPADFSKPKVHIKAVLKSDPAIYKEFEIYIKQTPDPELKTLEEILHGNPASKKKKS